MAEYCISCCSTADLTKEYFDKRGIRYVCFHYELGGTDYLDDLGQTMPPAELYRRMLAGEDVKTSQVSIGEYADFFRKIFDEGKDILHLTLSSGISGSYNSACIAAEQVREEYPNRKIYVVDSLAASSGYGLLVWVNIGGLVAIFFAPLSGLFVRSYSIVPVVRVLYFLFALTMILKTLITFRFCHETKQGKIRRAETRGISVFHMLGEYRQLIPGMLKNRGVLKAVAVSVILYVTNMVSTNFFGLYVTQRLGLSENFLALFPILNAAV